jgi:hypothetical protein
MTGALGRLHAPDPQDCDHMLRAIMGEAPPALPPYKYWAFFDQPLDQGREGSCVGHGWKHFLMAEPIRVSRPNVDPTAITIYHEAQKVDEFPGEDYEGTSVRAGAKYLQSRGIIGEYRWAFDLRTLAEFVLLTGPVVVGMNWYSSMDSPDAQGVVRITNGARIRGGHCWLILGRNEKKAMSECLNSWGIRFAKKGRFYVPDEYMERLIKENGEACSTVELKA